MSISTQWFNGDSRVLLTTLEGEHTLNDYMEIVMRQRELIAALPETVHRVYIFQHVPRFPRAGITTFSHLGIDEADLPGLHIVVGQYLFFQSILSVMRKIAPTQYEAFQRRITFTRTIGEALAVIRQRDEGEQAANV